MSENKIVQNNKDEKTEEKQIKKQGEKQCEFSSIPFSRLIDQEKHSNFIDLIKCKICFNILNNPYDCNKCGNSFCRSCILNLLSNNKPCPFNCTSYSIKPSSFGITSYLSKLEFTCRNKANGCNEKISYANLSLHDKECKFFFTICPNRKCGKKLKWTLVEEHIRNECEYSLFQCPTCSLEFYRNEFQNHIKNCVNIRESLCLKFDRGFPNEEEKKEFENKEKQCELYFEGLMKNLPEIKDVPLLSILKTMMYQINLTNEKMNQKFEGLKKEMGKVREDVDRVCKNNMIFFESINNELENISSKISKTDNTPNKSGGNLVDESMTSVIYTNDKNQNFLSNNTSMLNEIGHNKAIKKRVKFSPSLEKSDDETNPQTQPIKVSKKPAQTNNNNQNKRVKTLQISKNISTVGNRPAYSPRNVAHNNNNQSNVLNTSGGNIETPHSSRSPKSQTNELFKPPTSKPFNTFSSYTNSNLVNIIHNQEIIIKEIKELGQSSNNNQKEIIKEIRSNEMTTLNAFASVKEQIINNQLLHIPEENKKVDENKDFSGKEGDNEKDELLVEPGTKDILNNILDEI